MEELRDATSRMNDGPIRSWMRAVSPARGTELLVSGFLDKAKEMAESVKDQIEDHIPDNLKEKLHLGNDPVEAVPDVVEGAADDAAPDA
jgi:hypothetical protein